eukprot:COSAG05_NODE_7160_length_848_cov_1.369826_1_plen_200_part_00
MVKKKPQGSKRSREPELSQTDASQAEESSDSDSEGGFDPTIILMQIKKQQQAKAKKGEKKIATAAAASLRRIAKAADAAVEGCASSSPSLEKTQQTLQKIQRKVQRAGAGKMGGKATKARGQEFDAICAELKRMPQHVGITPLSDANRAISNVSDAQANSLSVISKSKKESLDKLGKMRKRQEDPTARNLLKQLIDKYY